ncbi:MAG: HAMP domain-containing histidine kinase, partial [Prevotella sp.]|nr:HAMP domain-containing histidine kinase [Prevotella sp.]
MKKSTIWILAAVMAIAFFGLLFIQISYLRISINMRNEQFKEAVNRSLFQVARNLELDQTKKYLNEVYIETKKKEAAAYNRSLALRNQPQEESVTYRTKMTAADGFEFYIEQNVTTMQTKPLKQVFQSPKDISKTFFDLQEEQKERYIYEKNLMEDVLNRIIKSASDVPLEEKVNFKELETNIKDELKTNNIELPFQYEIVDKNNKSVYKQPRFNDQQKKNEYPQVLFPNNPANKVFHLKVYFPDRGNYLSSEVSFLYPALIFTIILLITFIIMLYITFRQKRLSEMKSDFMNNMTHELKTPVSTISLAAQMLKDGSVTKSPDVFKHISGVINDETERLSFQVEKVLQMSLFEKQKATLKMKELDANDIVVSVANTFQLKVEKFGGNLDIDLEATDSAIEADKMHFTNVLFNLLDNAVKYRKENVPL